MISCVIGVHRGLVSPGTRWGRGHRWWPQWDEALTDPGVLGSRLGCSRCHLQSLPVAHTAAVPADSEPVPRLLPVADQTAGQVHGHGDVSDLCRVRNLEPTVREDVNQHL